MIHPATELRFISEAVGYGVFATQHLPKGTIVFVKDPLDIELSEQQIRRMHPDMQAVVEKYSYIDERGKRIVSWDHAKYVNNCCRCNTISTGYGFEIALRDIASGEELTDEYGLFNLDRPMRLHCSKAGCRGWVLPQDPLSWAEIWDQWVLDALRVLPEVDQPLYFLLERGVQYRLEGFLQGRLPYCSVRTLLNGLSVSDPSINDPNVAA